MVSTENQYFEELKKIASSDEMEVSENVPGGGQAGEQWETITKQPAASDENAVVEPEKVEVSKPNRKRAYEEADDYDLIEMKIQKISNQDKSEYPLFGEDFFKLEERTEAELQAVRACCIHRIEYCVSKDTPADAKNCVVNGDEVIWKVELILRKKLDNQFYDRKVTIDSFDNAPSLGQSIFNVISVLQPNESDAEIGPAFASEVSAQGVGCLFIGLEVPGWNKRKYYPVDLSASIIKNMQNRLVQDHPRFLVMLLSEAKPQFIQAKLLNDQGIESSIMYYKTSLVLYEALIDKDSVAARICHLRMILFNMCLLDLQKLNMFPSQQLLDLLKMIHLFVPAKNLYQITSIQYFENKIIAVLDERRERYANGRLAEPRSLNLMGLRAFEDVIFGTLTEIRDCLHTRREHEYLTLKKDLWTLTPQTAEAVRVVPTSVPPPQLNVPPPQIGLPMNMSQPPPITSKTFGGGIVKLVNISNMDEEPTALEWRKRRYGDWPRLYSAPGFKKCYISPAPQPIPMIPKDYITLEDMTAISLSRTNLEVFKPFRKNPAVLTLFELLTRRTGIIPVEDFKIVRSDVSNLASSVATVYLSQRAAKIQTLGQAQSSNMKTATTDAYAQMLCALCYMQVIPFEMVQALPDLNLPEENWLEAIIYACKDRFKTLFLLSDTPEFRPLCSYNGQLSMQAPSLIQDLWKGFIWKMRCSGYAYWSEHRNIIIPDSIVTPPLYTYPGTYFTFSKEHAIVDWDDAMPRVPEELPEYPLLFIHKYGEQEYEQGMIPRENNPDVDSITGAVNWGNQPTIMPQDSVVWLTAREFERRPPTSPFVHSINTMLLNEITDRWNKKLIQNSALVQDTNTQFVQTFHSVSIKFEGIAQFFFKGVGKHVCYKKAVLIAESYFISSLILMGIIPVEMYLLIRKFGEEWITPVIYACRRRFAHFELLYRNLAFFPLFAKQDARFYETDTKAGPALLKNAYDFFQRMRSTATLYWNQNPLVVIPHSIPLPESRLQRHYFTFVHGDTEEDWESMFAKQGDVDNRFGDEMNRNSCHTFDRWNTPIDHWDVTVMLNRITVKYPGYENTKVELPTISPEFLVKLHAEMALLMGLPIESMKEDKENPKYNMRYSGDLGWLFLTTVEATEEDFVFRGGMVLLELLVRTYILPLPILKFLIADEKRLNPVIYAMRGLLGKVRLICRTFATREDENKDELACSVIHRECFNDWPVIRVAVNHDLVPKKEEAIALKHFQICPLSSEELSTQILFHNLTLPLVPVMVPDNVTYTYESESDDDKNEAQSGEQAEEKPIIEKEAQQVDTNKDSEEIVEKDASMNGDEPSDKTDEVSQQDETNPPQAQSDEVLEGTEEVQDEFLD